MDVLGYLIRQGLSDWYLRRDGYHLSPYRKLFATTQTLPPDELAAYQYKRLHHILHVAWASNSYYHQRFTQCGFTPRDFRSISDLQSLPILTKDDVRNSLVRSFTDGFSSQNTVHKRTGGSTGTPLHVYYDRRAASAKKAAVERHNSWAGHRIGDRIAGIWGDTSTRLPLRTRIRNAVTVHAFFLDTLRFDPPAIDAFIARIRALRPPTLIGHAHSVYRLAEYVQQKGMDNLRFHTVITTAMVLSDHERAVIEAVFQSPVFDRYGCEELSIIASECEAHDGMHIFAEGLYVEVLSDSESSPGKLVITDLFNTAMPLIRYVIGDHGTPAKGPCPCGRTLPKLQRVYGRTADFLYTPDRVPVFGISILDTFVIHIPGIKQAQIIQDAFDHLVFRIVRDASFGEHTLALLKRNVEDVFGRQMRYNVEYVERIAQTQDGKFRFSICEIPECLRG